MSGRAKPGERFGGRQKGTPNKVTRELREMILAALDSAGGEKYLRAQAKKNPGAFMTLVGKVLPLQHTGEIDTTMTIIRKIVGETQLPIEKSKADG